MRELRREKQQRADDHAQQKYHHHRNLNLEVRQCGSQMENAICDKSREQRTMRNREQRKRIRCARKETDAGVSVRMCRNQTQWESRHFPQEPCPDEEPKIPTAQNKLKKRQTNIAIPQARERQFRS